MTVKTYFTNSPDTARQAVRRTAEDLDKELDRQARHFAEGVIWGIVGSTIAWLIVLIGIWGGDIMRVTDVILIGIIIYVVGISAILAFVD